MKKTASIAGDPAGGVPRAMAPLALWLIRLCLFGLNWLLTCQQARMVMAEGVNLPASRIVDLNMAKFLQIYRKFQHSIIWEFGKPGTKYPVWYPVPGLLPGYPGKSLVVIGSANKALQSSITLHFQQAAKIVATLLDCLQQFSQTFTECWLGCRQKANEL